MKTRKHLVAFAALLSPALLFATSINVTFDTALTNTMGWTYSDDVKKNNTGYYVGGHKARITSASFNFAVTSIVLHVKTTPSCTRNLVISSYYPETSSIGLSQTFSEIQTGANDLAITAIWHPSDQVRAVSIDSTDGAQNLYFLSAIISGVPIVEVPTNLQTNDIKGTRCRLLWTNPENAVSNCVEVSSVQLVESTGRTVEEFGFDEISAGGNSVSFAKFCDSLPPHYEKLSGTYLYAAANSAGLLQISTGKNRGELVYSGCESYTDLTLRLILKRYSGDANTMTIGWTDGGSKTNSLETINLADDFTTEFIGLSSVADGAMIIFNNSGKDDNHRIIIDEIAFVRDYSPASVSTNLVKTVFTTGNAATIRGLSPNSSYVVSVSAFDEDGNESKQSELISFMTGSEELPFIIRLQ